MTATAARRAGWPDAACVALLAGWAVALALGVGRHRFDYDELEQIYAIWRIKTGARPFYDFFEVHPPLLWYPLALLLRPFAHLSSPAFGYRVVTLAGHLASLLALGRNVALSFERLPSPRPLRARSFALGVLLFAGASVVMGYLVEFRLDAWPNALLFFAILRHRRATPSFRASFELALLALLAIVWSPKLIALFGLYALVDLARGDQRGPRLGGLAAGAAASLLLAALALAAARLDPRLVYRLVIAYHQRLNAAGGFGHQLARAVAEQPALLALMASSLIGWFLVMGRRCATQTFELAVALFLAFQLAFVSFGYRQYFAPWFLFGVVFFPYLELALQRTPVIHRAFLVVVLMGGVVNVVQSVRGFQADDGVTKRLAFDAWAALRVPPDATVAGAVSRLPLYRRSALSVVVYSIAPSGISTADLLNDVGLPGLAAQATGEASARELEAAQPMLVIEGGILSPTQTAALARYRARHRDAYQRVDSPTGPVYLRTR